MGVHSGFGPDTAKRFMIDAGVIYKDITWNSQTNQFEGDILGATSGGVEINIEKKYRKVEVDGAYIMDVVGLNQVESEQATIKATIVELSAEMLTLAVGGVKSADIAHEGYEVIEGKYSVADNDYIENMGIFGYLAGNEKPVIFLFDNLLVTSALSIKMEDKKEAGVEIEGQANATFEQLRTRTSPWRVFYPTGEEVEVG